MKVPLSKYEFFMTNSGIILTTIEPSLGNRLSKLFKEIDYEIFGKVHESLIEIVKEEYR